MRRARGQLAQQRQVEHVALDEAQVLVLGEIGAGQRVAVQVVEHDDLVLGHEPPRERGADEARAARSSESSSRSEHDRPVYPCSDGHSGQARTPFTAPQARRGHTGAVIAQQLGRLAKHSAIYGLGAVVSRLIGVLLLPIVTRYLTRADVGAVETLISLTVVLVIVLRMGISMAFFRFYFDAEDEARPDDASSAPPSGSR